MPYRNPLNDKVFLKQLDEQKEREIYIKLIALNKDEYPVQEIQGKSTGGNVNIDGNSAVRRTCSLSMVAKDVDINSFYWGLYNKFRVEVGLKNTVDRYNYDDIIWFKQGTFIITNFTTSQSTNNFTISITGKDKMCLLNGEVGGSIPYQTDFGTEETIEYEYEEVDIDEDDWVAGFYYSYNSRTLKYNLSYDYSEDAKPYYRKTDAYSTIYRDVPVKEIITNMLHAYAGEPYHNIIIQDLDDKGLELLEYRGETPLYMTYNQSSGMYTNVYFGGIECFTYSEDCNGLIGYKIDELPADFLNSRIDLPDIDSLGKTIYFNYDHTDSLDETNVYYIYDENNELRMEDGQYCIVDPKKVDPFTISKLQYGETAGFRLTDLVYPGELIANAGEALTSILDKIKSAFGDFEYFYDVDGRFIWRLKPTYVNTVANGIIETDGEEYADNAASIAELEYHFENGILITSYQNTPNLLNLRNDFSIWGSRISVNEQEIPIHMRYAIDEKPRWYKSLNDHYYVSDNKYKQQVLEAIKSDCEIYFIKNQMNNLSEEDKEEFINLKFDEKYHCVDWRELIYQMAKDYMRLEPDNEFPDFEKDNFQYYVAERNADYYPTGITGYEHYYTDLLGFWRQLYNPFINVELGDMVELSSELKDYAATGSQISFKLMNDDEDKEINLDTLQINVKTEPVVLKSYEDWYLRADIYLEDLLKEDPSEHSVYNLNKYPGSLEDSDEIYKYSTDSAISSEFYNALVEKFLKAESSGGDVIMSSRWASYIQRYKSDFPSFEDDKDKDGNYIISWEKCKNALSGLLSGERIKFELIENKSDILNYSSVYIFNKDKNCYQNHISKLLIDNDWYDNENVFFTFLYNQNYYNINDFRLKDHIVKEEDRILYDMIVLNEVEYDSTKSYQNVNITYKYPYYEYYRSGDRKWWNKEIIQNPSCLNFWFDFLDSREEYFDKDGASYTTGSELDSYKVSLIGDRPKVVNDKDVSSIYFREVPNLIYDEDFSVSAEELMQTSGYVRIQGIPYDYFTISAQGKSAKDKLDELIYQHSYCIETINISAIPVYYLEPNMRILVSDRNSKIDGEYIVSRVSFPLNHTGTMTVGATKAPTRLY